MRKCRTDPCPGGRPQGENAIGTHLAEGAKKQVSMLSRASRDG